MTPHDRKTLRVFLILAVIPCLLIGGYFGYCELTRRSLWAINPMLERHGIPQLPASSRVLNREETYNIFHAWFDIKVSLDEKSIQDYEAGLHFEKLLIGEKRGMVRIMDVDDPEPKGLNAYTKGPEIQFREQLADWWDTKAITNGLLYRHADTSRTRN